MSESSSAHGQAEQRPAPPVRSTRKRRTGRAAESQAAATTPDVLESPERAPAACLSCGCSTGGVHPTSEPLNPSGSQSTTQDSAVAESSTTGSKRKSPQNTSEKFHAVMALLGSKNHFTLGDFFECLFAERETLTDSERTQLSAWLKGRTKSGYRPVEAVVAMYQHSLSLRFSGGKLEHSDFSELAPQDNKPLFLDKYPRSANLLPPASSSPEHFSAREGLEELFARSTLAIVDLEAEKLCAKETGLSRGANTTWDLLLNYSLAREHSVVQNQAPVSWAIASTMAWSRKREWKPSEVTQDLEDVESDDEPASQEAPIPVPRTGASDRARNPVLAILIVFLILLLFRNKNINLFQHFLGVFLFACNSPKQVYQVLGRLGIASAHSTVHLILGNLANSAYKNLALMGSNANESALDPDREQEYFGFVMDNVNKGHKAWKQSVAKATQVKSGTAATAIGLEDVQPGAFKPEDYFARLDSCP
ncbi:hypothetical protein FRC12_005057 [Ceratobasidium sp. 428]|nr:hypothetical protein FRC12_005057 [Ceratobasidium sp. 428]